MQKTLIKIDSKGKVRVLNIWNEGAELKKASGLLGGKLTLSDKTCKAKNFGKSNATTAEEQAIIEVQADANRKSKKDYVFAPDNIDSMSLEEIVSYVEGNKKDIPSAMLAKSFDDKYLDYDYGFLCSAKLDGLKCLADIKKDSVTLYFREGDEILTMGHIVKQLEEFRDATGFIGVLDGELYSHDENEDNFQQIMRAIKKYRPGISEQVQYFVYDLKDDTLNAKQRYDKYCDLLIDQECLVSVKPLAQYNETNMEGLEKMHQLFLKRGYEGTIIKNAKSIYKEGKSTTLLKLKDFEDNEFLIVDVVGMEKKPERALMVLEIGDTTFKATPSCSNEEKEEILRNKEDYIGKMGTVRYFGFTESGIPRIATFKGVRLEADLPQ